jgi:hypothetical protein
MSASDAAGSSSLRRFQNLEIGVLHQAPLPASDAGQPISQTPQILCHHCGQANEAAREFCWACSKELKAVQEPTSKTLDVITIVLNGKSYCSNDPGLPDDIKILMDHIRKNGYSEELINQWKQWRLTRNSDKVKEPAAERQVSAFSGNRISVLRIDGKVYTSDQTDLPQDIQTVMNRISREGVTPGLLEELRRQSPSQGAVKYRPHSTPLPSDGDVCFWDAVFGKTKVEPS